MTLRDRQQLAKDVQHAEGYRAKAYKDTEGVWTIGYGTNLQELTIDEPLAARWLARKLAESERELETFGWYAGLTTIRQRALVELVYNMGLPRLLSFVEMLKAIREKAYTVAAAELLDSKWAQQVGPMRSRRIAEMIRNG